MNTQNPIIVHAPASKSVSHRMVMGASLANGESVVENVLESQDLFQTMEILSNAGARFEKIDKGTYKLTAHCREVVKTCNMRQTAMCMNRARPAASLQPF